MAATDQDQAVYTYGWDTAFAIPVGQVNKAIVDHKSSPAAFSLAEDSYSASADFGDWQLCQGGDGKNVRMALPLKNGELTYTSSGKVIPFTSGRAVVEIRLHFIPHKGAFAGAMGKPMALVAKDIPSDGQPVMSVIELTVEPQLGTVSHALVAQALSDWGNAHLGEFSHVFSVVDLNRMVDQGRWGFVTPNFTSYAYLDRGTLDDSLLAVLTMTGTRNGDELSEQVSPGAIPAGSVAGFLVSQQRTLYDLIRPAIMLAYQGLTDQDFLLNDDATVLYLTQGSSVSLPPVQHEGSTYYPVLKGLSVKADGKILTLTSYTETEVAAGITATCQSTHWYTMELANSKNGQTLAIRQTQDPSIVHDIHQSPGSVLTQIIIAVVATVALLILTILTAGAALVVAGLVIGLILGADQLVPALIEKVNHDDSPAIDLLLVNAVSPIRWTASGVFLLTYGGLNVSLQLGGDPRFV